MLDQTKEYDPFDEANNPPEKTFDLFGKVELNAWACAFQKGVKGGVPFDPAIHQKRHTMVDIFIQPLPEMNVKYPKSLEFHDVTWSLAWTKFVLPSLKALGIDNVREVNDKWARIARVPTGETYPKKDAQGNPTGEMAEITTFKFIAFYATEDECRAAYLAAGGTPSNGHNAPQPVAPVTNEDTERATAYQFLKVIVANAARGKATFAEAQEAVGLALQQYPTVAKFYLANSVETGELITETTKLLPF